MINYSIFIRHFFYCYSRSRFAMQTNRWPGPLLLVLVTLLSSSGWTMPVMAATRQRQLLDTFADNEQLLSADQYNRRPDQLVALITNPIEGFVNDGRVSNL